eukprot:CAMPEP_0197075794 /NCGR_PEP_ID=MMETSP1384-20130603/211790_1 /TAXON_ID=29189 /ORGANISM="Ammonia sp." /LENGTH=594 /DNA_ID=CAMNT_0042514643 /DNA_START=138 /DNA_END=1922 /DNA_ORIENTATION=+
MVPPIMVVVLMQSKEGCQGTEFVVYAHYSTHEWLTAQFNQFTEEHGDEFPDVCFELRIGDSEFDNEAKPSIWIPETDIWIDLAEDEYDTLITNRSGDCSPLSLVPFGVITWSKFARLISPNGDAIPFRTLTALAEGDWDYINPVTNETIVDYFNGTFTADSPFYFGHGHPNVTSGGLLGFITMYSSLSGTTSGDVFSFTSGPTDCANKHQTNTNYQDDVIKPMRNLAQKTVATAPIDYTLPGFMMSRGPLYLQMVFGFENDVALLNQKYKERMSYLWNDTLAFLYLSKTYWVEHPICKLTGAKWYDEGHKKIADAFVNWLVNVCSDCILSLQEYGIRPYPNGQTVNTSTSIITEENGCNLGITPSEQYVTASAQTVSCVRYEYGLVKKELRLFVLLDVSTTMQTAIISSGEDKTRWNGIPTALPLLATNLADTAAINLTCFNSQITPCSNADSYPNGTLATSREKLITYFSDQLTTTEISGVHVFDALNDLYVAVQAEQKSKYRYVILVISSAAESGTDEWAIHESAESLFNTVGLQISDPNEIHIYTILYHPGAESALTGKSFEEIATRTNGQYAYATAEDLSDVIEEFTYYW